MPELAQAILNGILLGGLYAAIAVGLSVMFGIVKVVNLAHGDLVILGAYLLLVTMTALEAGPFICVGIVVPLMFVAGYLLQKLLFNRALDRGAEPTLMTALGVSVIVQNVLLVTFSPDARSLPWEHSVTTIQVADGLVIPLLYAVAFFAGVGIVAALHLFLGRTYLGMAIRAASDDAQAASLVGVNPKTAYSWAMGLAAGTAGVSGALTGMLFTFYPHSGPQYLITAFGVVIIGGVGSVAGTLLGGIALGLAQTLGAYFLGPGRQLLAGNLLLLIILAVRPEGFFGAPGKK